MDNDKARTTGLTNYGSQKPTYSRRKDSTHSYRTGKTSKGRRADPDPSKG